MQCKNPKLCKRHCPPGGCYRTRTCVVQWSVRMGKKSTDSAALMGFPGQSEHLHRCTHRPWLIVVKLCTGMQPRTSIRIADFQQKYTSSPPAVKVSAARLSTSLTSLGAHSLHQITPACSQFYAKPTHPLSTYFNFRADHNHLTTWISVQIQSCVPKWYVRSHTTSFCHLQRWP